MKFIRLIFPILLVFTSATGQENIWSLQRCINYALENNIQIKQQELNAAFQENTLEQSMFERFPNLNANASHSYSFGRALDETTYRFTENENLQSNNFSASSMLTLFNGFQIRNTIRQNRLNLLASMEDVKKSKNDISLSIALAYLYILFNHELLAVAQNQLGITRQQVERTQLLVNAGSLPMGNLLEIKAQEANEELQLVNSQNDLEISYLNLTQLLELDSVGDFRIEVPEFDIPLNDDILYSVSEIFSRAVLIMPQVKSAEYQLNSAETGMQIARGMKSPRLSLNTYYSTRYSDVSRRLQLDQNGNPVLDPFGNPLTEAYPFFDQLWDNINYGIGFSLSIPIFNNMQVSTAMSNARLSYRNSELVLENTRNILYKEIQQKFADALAALKRYKASMRTVESMEEAFRYTEQKFSVGLVTSVEYNTSKNLLTRAQSDNLNAKYEYLFQVNVLEFYMGNPIKL